MAERNDRALTPLTAIFGPHDDCRRCGGTGVNIGTPDLRDCDDCAGSGLADPLPETYDGPLR